MSKWYEPESEDMYLSEDEKEIDVLIDSDSGGNVYVSLKVEDLKKLIEVVNEKE